MKHTFSGPSFLTFSHLDKYLSNQIFRFSSAEGHNLVVPHPCFYPWTPFLSSSPSLPLATICLQPDPPCSAQSLLVQKLGSSENQCSFSGEWGCMWSFSEDKWLFLAPSSRVPWLPDLVPISLSRMHVKMSSCYSLNPRQVCFCIDELLELWLENRAVREFWSYCSENILGPVLLVWVW